MLEATIDVYQEVKAHFSTDKRVVVNSGKGAQGIKAQVKGKTKMIIMFSKGDLLIQLAPEQVIDCIAENKGQAYDPGTGKPMKDRLLVPASRKDTWIDMAEMSIRWALSQ